MSDKRISQTKLTDSAVERLADRLLTDDRVNDYFDRMIYATAATENSHLLTEDKALIALKDGDRKPAPRSILSWRVVVS